MTVISKLGMSDEITHIDRLLNTLLTSPQKSH